MPQSESKTEEKKENKKFQQLAKVETSARKERIGSVAEATAQKITSQTTITFEMTDDGFERRAMLHFFP